MEPVWKRNPKHRIQLQQISESDAGSSLGNSLVTHPALDRRNSCKAGPAQDISDLLGKNENSRKSPLIMRMNEAKNDVRSVIGSNLRNIMILAGKFSVEDVKVEDVDTIPYFNLSEDEH